MSRRGKQVAIWVIGLVVTAVMLGLGLWQMRSFQDQGQEALIQRMREPAVELAAVAPVGQEPGDAYGRTVRATGTYLPGQQLLIPDEADPSRFRVLTALQLDNGSVVAVVRGVALNTDPPPPPAGPVVQSGIFLPSEGEAQQPLPGGQLGTVRLPLLAQLWPQAIVPGFINLDAAGAAAQGLTAAQVRMPSNAGNARSQGYALQWWIFAAAAMAATVKLSRDAAKGTGFVPHVEQSVDNPLSGDDLANSPGGETNGTGARPWM